MLHAQRSSGEYTFGRLPACLPDTPTSEMYQLSISSSPASQSSSRPGHRAPGSGGPALPGAPVILWGTSADSQAPGLRTSVACI